MKNKRSLSYNAILPQYFISNWGEMSFRMTTLLILGLNKNFPNNLTLKKHTLENTCQ